MDTDTAILLSKYNAWADAVLFNAVANLPDGIATQPTATLFGSILGTLNHNYQVDLIWRANLMGEDHGYRSRRILLHDTVESLRLAQADSNAWLCDWAKRQSHRALQRAVAFRYISGKHANLLRGTILLHLINHKTYHRGWVSEMFFASGQTPPETDLCVFVDRMALSSPIWDLMENPHFFRMP